MHITAQSLWLKSLTIMNVYHLNTFTDNVFPYNTEIAFLLIMAECAPLLRSQLTTLVMHY